MRALISVSDKRGVVEFGARLQELGFEIISTGGTKKALEEGGVEVIGISEWTGFPEVLGGRVKTLHPAVHGGILARDTAEHLGELEGLGLEKIDLVCVNLYPFGETIRKGGSFQEAVEQIDIGGPTMIRAAAKNHERAAVAVDRGDYDSIIEELESGGLSASTRRKLAAKAFRHTAAYDGLIAEYLSGEEISKGEWPEKLSFSFERVEGLRYGENPHQKAAFYRHPLAAPGGLAEGERLHGKALSYNNINDANAALEMVAEFREPAAVAVKHMNPCGVGIGESIAQAFRRAREGDPVSIFGGIIALNRPVDRETAEQLDQIFLEIVLAPSFDEEALEVLKRKKNLRLIAMGAGEGKGKGAAAPSWKLVSVNGGILVQSADRGSLEGAEWKVATERAPSAAEERALRFGWRVVKHVKSNAIVVNGGERTFGIGAGQMNRVGAAEIALRQAGEAARGAAMASDAFFPMRDTVELAAKFGISAIIQPGGSIRDQESIEAADEAGIAMVLTGMRHFKH